MKDPTAVSHVMHVSFALYLPLLVLLVTLAVVRQEALLAAQVKWQKASRPELDTLLPAER
jgi:hypothetical protein